MDVLDDDPYMRPSKEPEIPLLDRLGLRLPIDKDYEPPKWRRTRVRIDTSDG
jgi:hypothetical protein